MPYRTILADPPWALALAGKYKRHQSADTLPYPVMSVEEIADLPIAELAEPGCHLWLWTTNQHLHKGFHVMHAWGFKYLAPIVWVKPSGIGNWFVHRTQTILFGYRLQCHFSRERYLPNIIRASPGKHSQKPEASYQLIERVSDPRRLELFARKSRPGWDRWGNECQSSPGPITVLGLPT